MYALNIYRGRAKQFINHFNFIMSVGSFVCDAVTFPSPQQTFLHCRRLYKTGGLPVGSWLQKLPNIYSRHKLRRSAQKDTITTLHKHVQWSRQMGECDIWKGKGGGSRKGSEEQCQMFNKFSGGPIPHRDFLPANLSNILAVSINSCCGPGLFHHKCQDLFLSPSSHTSLANSTNIRKGNIK